MKEGTVAGPRVEQGIHKLYFARKSADMLHLNYAVLKRFSDASKVPTNKFLTLVRLALCSVEPL